MRDDVMMMTSRVVILIDLYDRLYFEGGTRWFGADGRMDNILYPLKYNNERSSIIISDDVSTDDLWQSILLYLSSMSTRPSRI